MIAPIQGCKPGTESVPPTIRFPASVWPLLPASQTSKCSFTTFELIADRRSFNRVIYDCWFFSSRRSFKRNTVRNNWWMTLTLRPFEESPRLWESVSLKDFPQVAMLSDLNLSSFSDLSFCFADKRKTRIKLQVFALALFWFVYSGGNQLYSLLILRRNLTKSDKIWRNLATASQSWWIIPFIETACKCSRDILIWPTPGISVFVIFFPFTFNSIAHSPL